MNTVLDIKKLTKYYGKNPGIKDVSLSVNKGEIFGFIGPNGAGKSTTIRTVLGLIFPDSGTVEIFNENAVSGGAELRERIGYVPSEMEFYRDISVGKFLRYSADFYKQSDFDMINKYSELLMLDLSRKVSDLSLGNKKKVSIVQALLHKPDLLILDEPTSGLDPLIQSRFYEIIKNEQERGATVFMSSHTLSEVERMCSRVAIIKDGTIIKISDMNGLRKMAMKRFKIVLQKGVNPEEIDMDFGMEIRKTASGIEGLYTGNINDLLKIVSGLPLADLVLEDPGLEEIFMHYYS